MRAVGFGRILAQEPSGTLPYSNCAVPCFQPRGYSCMESEKQMQRKSGEGARRCSDAVLTGAEQNSC